MAITRVRPTADVVLRDAGARFTYEELEQARMPSGKVHSYADSFGQSRFISQLVGDGEYKWRYWWKTSGEESPTFVPTDFAVPDAHGVWMCRPFLDVYQPVRKADWTFSPDGYADSWEEVAADIGLDQDYTGADVHKYEVHMKNSTPNGPAMQAMSRFDLPPNPFFVVSLRRGEPHADHTGDAYTAIHFGHTADAGYALIIPYKEPAYLARRYTRKKLAYMTDERGLTTTTHNEDAWVRLKESEQSLQIPSLEGFPKGERVLVWIGVIGGKIAVSTDGFRKRINLWGPEDEAAQHSNSVVWTLYEKPLYGGGYSQTETQMPTVFVREGRVVVEGRGAAFSFGFFPCYMFDALLRSKWIGALYKTQDTTGGDRSGTNVVVPWMPFTDSKEIIDIYKKNGPYRDDYPFVVKLTDVSPVRDHEDNPESYKDWFRQWELLLQPREDEMSFKDANGNDGSLSFYRTPQVSFVTMSERVAPTAATLNVDATLTEDDVKTARGDYVQGSNSGRFTLELDNQLGGLKSLGARRWFEYAPGWVLNNDALSVGQEYVETAVLFGGYSLEPVLGIEAGGRGHMEVPLQDDFLRLSEQKVDGRVPAFDECTAKTALEFAFARCGVPDSKLDLEDTGKVLPGSTSEWLFNYDKGRTWADGIWDICWRDHNAALWIEPDGTITKGCRFCRSKRTNTPSADSYWGKHRHYNDTGCLAVDLTRNSSGVYAEYYTRGGTATDPETGYGEVGYIEWFREELPGLEFATWVEVGGKDVRGRPITVVANCEAAVRDPTDARFTGGWHIHDFPHHEDAVLTVAEAADLAKLRLFEVCHCNDFVRITTPFDQNMRKGYVFQVKGAENIGLDGVNFRCVGLTYDMARPGWPVTNVMGRRMSHANAPALPG